ncbi:MAG: rhodanese-related sulfurtransferase [Cyclobacteriaceae bacterium]
MKYNVLLYYCYSKIENVDEYREEHHIFCIENNLKGRIIISAEGLNGTVSGAPEDCDKYMKYVLDDPRFSHTEFKVEPSDTHSFAKLHVRVKPEIVNSSLRHIDPNKQTGKYIEPDEFRKLLNEESEDTVIVDVRSNYEHKVGKFKNAITFDIDNFREFPDKLSELEQYRDKKIVTYCTGGIKCEKASAYLLEQGFEDVHQLHGGIIKYGIEEQGENFEGKCYVFDNRVVKEVNTVNPKVISRCYITGAPSDRMVNCANPECNKHIPMTEEGAEIYNGCCSEDCMKHPNVRPYDGTGAYGKEMNGYNPYKGWKRRGE